MNIVGKLNVSREIILKMLKIRNYNIDKYTSYTINEIDTMYSSSIKVKNNYEDNALDIIIRKDNNKIIVKYLLNNKIRLSNINTLIANMLDSKINDGDSLIVITNDKIINESLDENIENIYQKRNIFIQVFWIDTLLFDITKHTLVPQHEIVGESEKESLLSKYELDKYSQLPLIMRGDPVAKFYGGKKGDVFKITRDSETAGEYIFYRYCQ